MAHIFISYRRDDAAYVAGMLSERLKKEFGPASVFMDVDTIPLGVDFREHLNNAVAKCDVFLAIIGDSWLGSPNEASRRIDDPTDYVRIEIEAALQRDIPIIPVLSGKAHMPMETDLPEPLRPIAFRNAAELRSGRDMNYHIDSLIRGLRPHSAPREQTAAAPSPTPGQMPPATRHVPKSRTIRTVCIIGALALLVTGGVMFLMERPSDQSTPPGEYLDDLTITTKVKTALLNDPQVSGLAINVETFKGTVLLSGFANSEDESQHAAELARSVDGVHSVQNDIRLRF